jgi:tetratricopeptide (TPR) repeat protein
VNERGLWRERLRPLVGFPGLLLLAFLIERMVLAPSAAQRPPESGVAFWTDQAQRHPEFPLTQLRLGIECARARDFDGAKAAFERVLVLDPHSEQAAIGLDGVLRAQGDIAGTVPLMESFLQNNPGCTACEQSLAVSLFSLRRLDEARRHVEVVLQRGDTGHGAEYGAIDLRTEALTLAGRIYVAQGEPERARHMFDEVLARRPNDAAARNEMARLDRLEGAHGPVR